MSFLCHAGAVNCATFHRTQCCNIPQHSVHRLCNQPAWWLAWHVGGRDPAQPRLVCIMCGNNGKRSAVQKLCQYVRCVAQCVVAYGQATLLPCCGVCCLQRVLYTGHIMHGMVLFLLVNKAVIQTRGCNGKAANSCYCMRHG